MVRVAPGYRNLPQGAEVKVLKSGCQAERLKLRTRDRLARVLADDEQPRGPRRPARSGLDGAEVEALDRAATGTAARPESQAPRRTVPDYSVVIAKPGGYPAFAKCPPPGNAAARRGLTRLTAINPGIELHNQGVGH
jgi:hypothetical protein